MRLEGDSDVCFGAGLCKLTAPEVFDQTEDEGTVVVLADDPPPDQHNLVRRAEQLCPSGAITFSE